MQGGRVHCRAVPIWILKKNIHEYCRKHTRNDVIMDCLDAPPVFEDRDEGFARSDEMEGDEAVDAKDEERFR